MMNLVAVGPSSSTTLTAAQHSIISCPDTVKLGMVCGTHEVLPGQRTERMTLGLGRAHVGTVPRYLRWTHRLDKNFPCP